MRAILMFHGVDDSGSVLSVTAEQLDSLLSAIKRSGHAIVSLEDMLESRPEQRLVTLTFDDAFLSVFDAARPVIEAHGATATVFVTTGYVGKDNRWPTQPADAPVNPIMSWEQVRALHDAGWSMHAHSVSHPDLRRLDDEQLDRELSEPRQALKQQLGITSNAMAYPYGYYDRRVASAARRYYEFAVTTNMGPLEEYPMSLCLPRIDAYYLRSPAAHRLFGDNIAFASFLEARTALRRLRKHPGEISI